MLYEDSSEEENSERRFHVELHFSPGAYGCFDVPPEVIENFNHFNKKHLFIRSIQLHQMLIISVQYYQKVIEKPLIVRQDIELKYPYQIRYQQ